MIQSWGRSTTSTKLCWLSRNYSRKWEKVTLIVDINIFSYTPYTHLGLCLGITILLNSISKDWLMFFVKWGIISSSLGRLIGPRSGRRYHGPTFGWPIGWSPARSPSFSCRNRSEASTRSQNPHFGWCYPDWSSFLCWSLTLLAIFGWPDWVHVLSPSSIFHPWALQFPTWVANSPKSALFLSWCDHRSCCFAPWLVVPSPRFASWACRSRSRHQWLPFRRLGKKTGTFCDISEQVFFGDDLWAFLGLDELISHLVVFGCLVVYGLVLQSFLDLLDLGVHLRESAHHLVVGLLFLGSELLLGRGFGLGLLLGWRVLRRDLLAWHRCCYNL